MRSAGACTDPTSPIPSPAATSVSHGAVVDPSPDPRPRCTAPGTTGFWNVSASCRSSSSRSCAGFISEQWKGALTGSNLARLAPRSSASFAARSTAAVLPEITICSGELIFAGAQTSPCAASAQTAVTFRDPCPGSRPSRPRRRAPLPAYTCRDCARCARHRRN